MIDLNASLILLKKLCLLRYGMKLRYLNYFFLAVTAMKTYAKKATKLTPKDIFI